MADAPVAIETYDEAWVASYASVRDRLEVLLAPWLAAPVEHVGSTAVPGLAAKPVVDVLAPVRNLRAASAAVPVLEAQGWLHWYEDPHGHRLWFLTPQPEHRTHHLLLVEHEHVQARALLAFRDALRADALLARSYAALKRRLAVEHPSNRNAYTNAKGDFVARVLTGVGAAVPDRQRLPE